MSEYATCISKLLDVFKDMIDKADYSNLENICHERIIFTNDFINKAITNGYCEYDLIDWSDYEDFQDERKRIMQKYRSKLYLGRD